MAIAVLQNVGTMLRFANAALQRIQPENPGEEATIPGMKAKSLEVVAALQALEAGSDPVPETVAVEPTPDFLTLHQGVALNAIDQLAPVTAGQMGDKFNEFKALKDRVFELSQALAKAQGRAPEQ